MGKYLTPAASDASLNYISNRADTIVICSDQPTSYSDVSNVSLGSASIAASSFALGNGDTSGRKLTLAAQSAVPISMSGTATHVALVSGANSELIHVTTCASKAVAAQGTADVDAYKVDEIQAIQ